MPILETINTQFGKVATFMDPQVGNPLGGLGMLGTGALAAFIMARRMIGGMSPFGRLLLGGGAGFLMGGGLVDALTGAMLFRGMGGTAGELATGAAGAAATAAGMTLGRRLLAGLLAIWRGMPKFLFLGAVISGIGAIADNWEAIKPRILAVWDDLKQAAPPWLGGQGQGWNAFAQGPAMTSLNNDLETWLRSTEASVQEWARGTSLYQWLDARGWTNAAQRRAQMRQMLESGMVRFAATPDQVSAAMRVAQGTMVSVTGNPITINITTPANASPQAIGEAAGNAVGSRLRQLLADTPGQPH